MMEKQIISFDLKADFGFLKKPDTNEPVYLTFNMLHKPALLGILGAILGLQGFQEHEKLPEYYQVLKNLKIGIKPLGDKKGNFQKTIIKYTNGVGYANDDGTLIVNEQTLIAPGYRCYLLLSNSEIHQGLKHCLKHKKADYLPYLGKNDFSLWWENVKESKFEAFRSNSSLYIDSIFIKEEPVKDGKKRTVFKPDKPPKKSPFIFFENLPVSYHPELYQYEYESFAYTNWKLKQEYQVSDLYKLKSNGKVIQLF